MMFALHAFEESRITIAPEEPPPGCRSEEPTLLR